MAKGKAEASGKYVCSACGHVHGKWVGRCVGCGEWNSVGEVGEGVRSLISRGVGWAGGGGTVKRGEVGAGVEGERGGEGEEGGGWVEGWRSLRGDWEGD